jgi:hypothetical protein
MKGQLLAATAQGRCIFTFNSRDFVPLARTYPHHHGILLAAQRSWNFPQLLAGLKHFLAETEGEAMIGQIVGFSGPNRRVGPSAAAGAVWQTSYGAGRTP